MFCTVAVLSAVIGLNYRAICRQSFLEGDGRQKMLLRTYMLVI
jgi:hypothetical protein